VTPLPVADLGRFLAGTWRIVRRIDDRLQAKTGRLAGVAAFVPVPGGLRYGESGALAWGEYRGEAACAYVFALDGAAGAEVRFPDGRRFHSLDLADGVAAVSHHCVPDRYDGLYRVRDRDRWTLAWLIEGPRKRSRIVTLYSRQS
jgi:3',5'-cyclic AMP phosphodiesterase CpdA